jgi:hypothetical protein
VKLKRRMDGINGIKERREDPTTFSLRLFNPVNPVNPV